MELTFEISEDELPVFLAETDDQLQLLDEGLLRLEHDGETTELLQELFRAAHTLKGAAGMIAHKRIVSLTHVMETAFDGLRKDIYKSTPPLINLCFKGIDALRELRGEVVLHKPSSVQVDGLTDQFNALVTSLTPSEKKPEEINKPLPIPIIENGQVFTIQAVISSSSVASAARAFQLVLALQDLGKITYQDPVNEVIETAKPVQTFRAHLQSEKTAQEILHSLEAISEIDKLTVDCHLPSQNGMAQQPGHPSQSNGLPSGSASSESIDDQDKNDSRVKIAPEKTVRTSVERLDNLHNLVGELITDRNRLHQIRTAFETRLHGNEDVEILAQTIAHISRITDQLQSEVMGIRMVPVANVFSKFPRMVRDLAAKLNKKIDLVIRGEDTELDRSLIELINDPLIHLLRNAVDHGIEMPEDRIAAGKPEIAKVLLNARHEQGHVILTVEDDGKGIDPERIRKKAVDKGFITAAEAEKLTPEEATNLIFYSGFSTADKVSDVSGRGVGLDIVRNNITRFNGSITLESWKNRGSRFEIILPLTLAIVQTLLIKVGVNRLAIPLSNVLSTVAVKKDGIQTINQKPVIVLRDRILPLLPLSEAYQFRTKGEELQQQFVVVVSAGKQQIGLLVDKLLGEEEVVVKSLGPLVGDIKGISSAAILGDGQVILIADIQDLFQLAGISQFKH